MFRTLARTFLPNRLDWILKRGQKKRCKNVLVCWNRGLGDIALGVAAIIHRIRQFLPECAIRILTRENLKDGFSLLDGIDVIADPSWKRGTAYNWKQSLQSLGIDPKRFDLVIAKPSPTDWCRWQRKTFTPRLKWNREYDRLVDAFDLPPEFTYIGVQVEAETGYGFWRNWPQERWQELFDLLEKKGNVRVLLFGYGAQQSFSHPMIIDLRGKTSLFQLLSIIKNRCTAMILPDSGILSMTYYLDVSFPIRLVTLWGDPNHGILKQGVNSPNSQLIHIPLIGERRDLSSVSATRVLESLFPKQVYTPLERCTRSDEVTPAEKALQNAACVILAGGQGSRVNAKGPKGLFSVLNKPLFQHHLEKIPASMPIALMTSPQNHQETVEYFQKNGCFGRKIWFFQQEALPLLDERYRPVGMGPNGNGSLYTSIVAHGILDEYEAMGIDTLLISPIENPLAHPADERLLSFHRQSRADVTIKCVERKQNESMGALGLENGRIRIVEYFQIAEDPFHYSYMGQAALSLSFVRRAASLTLPYYWIRKKAWIAGAELLVWKRECLFFDAFAAADQIAALCYPREVCYAPIKSPENKLTAEQLLLKTRESS